MVATVLYHKNGVLTEERFQKMTPIQWIFHYMEIMKFSNKEKKIFVERLDDINLGIQAFYLLIDKDRGLSLIDSVSKIKEQVRKKDGAKKSSNDSAPDNANDELPDLLSSEEKELWAFMEEQPKIIKETKEMRNIGRHILPTRNVKELKDAQTKIINSIKDIEKPKMGF